MFSFFVVVMAKFQSARGVSHHLTLDDCLKFSNSQNYVTSLNHYLGSNNLL